MPFSHSCFISYSGGKEELMSTFINELYDGLSSYIEPYFRNIDVYIDKERLKGGDFFDPILAEELCRSICMILVYTPRYFDKNYTFCTREFKLMEQLEKRRLALLSKQLRPTHGLIIPIVFLGGVKYLPPVLKNHRHCYDFSEYRLSSHSPMIRNEEYERIFKEIAEYIYKTYRRIELIEQHGFDICGDCDGINFPNENTIQDFLKTIIIPFPGY
jgi:hypothetical protein